MPECCQCGQDSEKIAELAFEVQCAVDTLRRMAGDVAHGRGCSVGDLQATARGLEIEAGQVCPPPEELEPYDREKCWHTKTPFKVSTHGSLHR